MISRVQASQLERRAFVYVRQSTTNQVLHHVESTKRQYALAERAVALGWQREQVEVIDEDQGRSGATSDERYGFARLMEAVAHGQAGAVLAVEVSRLARSSPDWQRLLSLCAVAETVVVDEEAIYDPSQQDDKLLLDIKGTMSEAELNWLRLRLVGAVRSKARRGELHYAIPTGYMWTEGGLQFDPDEAVQQAIKLVFERYAIEPRANAVLRWASSQNFLIPTRRWYSDGTSKLEWKQLNSQRVLEMIKNPTYAGVYAYGRRPARKTLVNGEIKLVRDNGRDPEKWAVKIENSHPGYITWETYVSNQEKLNKSRRGASARTAPHEGSALLGGLLVCGRCGLRMDATYSVEAYYRCRGEHHYGSKACWSILAEPVDRAVEEMFLHRFVPPELELSLAVEQEVAGQSEALERHWKLRIEQAKYEAQRAERRYKAVDPDNRVVARTLEREWEDRLRGLQKVEQQYAEARQEHVVELTAEDRRRIRALARDLSKIWKSKNTEQSERKAMLRLVVEAVSLKPVDVPKRAVHIKVAWKTGAVTELSVSRPEHARLTSRAARIRVRELCEAGGRDDEIAERLNAEGLLTGAKKPWSSDAVSRVRGLERIPCAAPRSTARVVPDRDEDGRFSVAGAARHFAVSAHVVRRWIQTGRIEAIKKKNVLWVTIAPATEVQLKDELERTANRYPRTVPPPPRA